MLNAHPRQMRLQRHYRGVKHLLSCYAGQPIETCQVYHCYGATRFQRGVVPNTSRIASR